MNAAKLLADLTARNVCLATVDGRLRVEAPAGTLTDADRRGLAEHKAEVLAIIAAQAGHSPPAQPSPPPASPARPWDVAAADRVLAEVNGILDAASRREQGPARRSVLGVYRGLALDYHARRDPLLFEAPAAVQKLLARWRAVDAGPSPQAAYRRCDYHIGPGDPSPPVDESSAGVEGAGVAQEKLSPPLKRHGGEEPLVRKIVALMPRHLHYVELCAGDLAVLLARDPDDRRLWVADTSGKQGVSEVINDLDGRVINFWRVLRREEDFARFSRMVEMLPSDEREWPDAAGCLDPTAPVARAVAFFAACRQALGRRVGEAVAVSPPRSRRSKGNAVPGWVSAVPGLPAIYRRLTRVLILNRPVADVIRGQDGPDTLFYCEGSRPHDRKLLDLLRRVQGKVMLSGVPSALYDEVLAGWERHTLDLADGVAGGQAEPLTPRVLWCKC